MTLPFIVMYHSSIGTDEDEDEEMHDENDSLMESMVILDVFFE